MEKQIHTCIFVVVIYDGIICSIPFKGLAPINEKKELRIHIKLHVILSTVTKNVRNMANSADPDETPCYAASHMGLRYL